MANIKIQEVYQRKQYTATSGQTAFSIPFPFFEDSDIQLYKDETLLDQGGASDEYTVSGAGSPTGGTATLNTGATSGDIITIIGATPIDRTSIYSATISNLTGSALNNDFNRDIVMIKQIETTQKLLQLQYNPYEQVSQDDSVTTDRWLPLLGANQIWAKNNANDEIIAYDVPSSGSGLAPKDAKYLVQQADADLPNAQDMSALASGFVVNTTSTGVQLTRTVDGTANEIDVTNSTGISGNPTIGISDNPVIPGTEGITIPSGTTAQRPGSPSSNSLRYNTDLGAFEFYNTATASWEQLEDSANFPTTSTDNAIARYDGTGGKLQNSNVLVTDDDDITQIRRIEFDTDWRLQADTVDGDSTLLLRAQTGNTNAELVLAPIGSATESKVLIIDDPNLNNYEGLELKSTSTAEIINSVSAGSGTSTDLKLQIDGTDYLSLLTAGNLDVHSNKLTNVSDPTADQDAATKAYVDSRTDLHFMDAVQAASTGNFASTYGNGTAGVGATLTASSNGAFSLDGEAGVLNARYLMKDQSTTYENGIYTLTQVGDGSNPAILTRATDFDEPSEIDPGDIVPVLNGTVNGSTAWLQTATVNTIGTDAITWEQWLVDFSNVVTIDGTQTVTGAKILNDLTLGGAMDAASQDINNVATLTINDAIQHSGDTDNQILFGTDTQDFQTGGSSRLDISDSGVRFGGANARITTILDEDDMSSDSDTAAATQQSIKAYVDSQVGSSGGFQSVQVFTSSGTWNRPSGISLVRVICIGGGGGGGAATSDNKVGGGGGGGGYSELTLDVTSISSETVTVGSGGAGGSGGDGTTGGTSSFGANSSATGGSGGIVNGFSGSPGTGVGGDFNAPGKYGIPAGNASSAAVGSGGYGANGIFGEGGSRGSAGGSGQQGDGYGSGGGGGYRTTSTSRNGGAGADGVIIVYEYS